MTELTRILTIIFALKSVLGLACDCSPLEDHNKLIEFSFNHYEQIFIGEIIEIDNKLWIEAKEIFKGDLIPKQLIKTGIERNSCSYHFKQKGLGLFYGIVTTNSFFASICSPTRMFNRPYLYPPPPPLLESESNPKGVKQRMINYEKVEKERLEYEIKQLRKRNNAIQSHRTLPSQHPIYKSHIHQE